MRVFSTVLTVALWFAGSPLAQAQVSGSTVPQSADSVPGVPTSAASAATAGRASPIGTLASLGADYRLGPNDLMDVEVFGLPDLKRTVRVNSSGQVSLALVGNVLLAGLSAQQAEKVIADKYSEKFLQNPQVSVFIREFTTQRITIEGAVGRPGIYPVTGQVTLLRVLAMAGGGGGYAELSDIKVFRVGENGVKITQSHDLNKIRTGEVADPPILADDVIVVKRNAIRAALRDSLFRDVIDSINPFSALVPK